MVGAPVITETFDYDGGRGVTVLLPSGDVDSVVYAGDGQWLAEWNLDLPTTMVVGVHSLVTPGDDGPRIYEYSPNFKPEVFAAHEAFFVGDVRNWVAAMFGVALPPTRTAIGGWSASGELALALGMRHPDVFGAVLCASPGGGYQPAGLTTFPLRRAYFVGGTEEQWFFDNAQRWADALTADGAEVVIRQRPGNHGGQFWRDEFPLQVAWAFGSA